MPHTPLHKLTESQKEIQRKRKISAAVTAKQEEKTREKRAAIDRLDLERIRARRAGTELPIRLDDRVILPSRLAKEQLRAERQPREELGAEIKETLPFRQELKEKTGVGELGIEGIPSLEPTPISLIDFFGDVGGLSSGEIAEMQRRGESPLTPEQNERRKIAGLTAVALGAALGLGIAGFVFVAQKFAAGAASKSAGAMAAYFAGTGLATAGTILGFGKITDFERADIEVQKKIIAGIVTSGERYESMTQNGLPGTDSLPGLSLMNDNINRAEEIIFNKGDLNLKYRNSNEYQEVMQKILDARNAVLRRTDAVINIGTTGSAQLNPELLAIQGQQMLDYAKNPLREQ